MIVHLAYLTGKTDLPDPPWAPWCVRVESGAELAVDTELTVVPEEVTCTDCLEHAVAYGTRVAKRLANLRYARANGIPDEDIP